MDDYSMQRWQEDTVETEVLYDNLTGWLRHRPPGIFYWEFESAAKCCILYSW